MALKLLFKDNFDGVDGALPHRGKWMNFLAVVPGGDRDFLDKICEINTDQMHIKARKNAVDTQYRSVNVLTRAEFKIPFTIEHDFRVTDTGFSWELNTAAIEDGLIQETSFYGKWLLAGGAQEYMTAEHTFCFGLNRIKDGVQQATDYSANGVFVLGTTYHLKLEITELSTGYYQAHLKITHDSVIDWEITRDFDRSLSESFRYRLFCGAVDDPAYADLWVDNFKVFGEPRKRIGKVVTIKYGPGYQNYANPTNAVGSSEFIQWTGPTGFSDPNSDWNNETQAYDDNTTSFAYDDANSQWHAFLYLTISDLQANKVRVWPTRANTNITQMDVDVYKDGAWVDLFSGAPTWGAYNEYSFTRGVVTQMRIRFYSGAIYVGGARVNEADFQEAYVATFVLDNNTSTYWRPITINEANAWCYIDMGSLKVISGFKIYFDASAAYRPVNYDLDYSSDAASWTQILNQSSDPGAGWKEHTFTKVVARYIRFQVNTHGATGIRLYEMMYREGYETIYKATDDILACSVSHRDGGLLTGSLVLKNKDNKYSFDYPTEIEIRLGEDDAMLWLLFRGYVDIFRKKYPDCTIEMDSAQGYAKRMNYREAKSKSYSAQLRGAIVKDLISSYFSNIFTTDHVSDGTSSSYTFDDAAVGEILYQLAKDEGYVYYVDENKDIHFTSAPSEETKSNIDINQGETVVELEYGLIDEILNKIYVEGSGVSGSAEDSASQSLYWLRERTFVDGSITAAGTATARATAFVNLYKDILDEISVALPKIFPINLFDKIQVKCSQVGLDTECIVKEYRHILDEAGIRTIIGLKHKELSMADILSEHQRKLEGTE
ncbi:MAG: discoidin domain-containing protein [Nitrososphaerales archaeon]|nr:discoidin domain-containing protein [Nitrososphaerales archaeon]